MKAIVVGSGGREHALAWKLLKSPNITEVVCIPGNGGTALLPGCRNVAMAVTEAEGIARCALVNNMAFVVVGPEQPLAEGLADRLSDQGIKVFGPNRDGAQIEASKAWAKDLMAEANVPTAAAATFTEAADAIAYVRQQGTQTQDAQNQDAQNQSEQNQSAPIVVKADGLAAGKGVTVAMTAEDAIAAVEAAFSGRFGAAGERVVIEEFLEGQEVSVLAVTDGQTIRPLLPAQDHKQIGEGDTGPNTGGMGAYSPTPLMPAALLDRVQKEVLDPTLDALKARGIDYRGVLYAGLIITPAGDPKVIEFNCRFGDPETQVVLPLLETSLDEIVLACCEQRLADLPPFKWQAAASACVVMAAKGYPGAYKKGLSIALNDAESDDTVVFHAGTRVSEGQLKSTGGRVLGVSAIAPNFQAALDKAYRAIDKIDFPDSYYRRDIGHRIKGFTALKESEPKSVNEGGNKD
ncbi:phosphoribosylamine--glycine ligase [cf. Phormidesmis sp. LEGE 11477]|uniref:phosphoribosylamine--glycine ligase n=1 Tax=cf. Phormidesmis sp. LEGE 11477 TaxID=1828680 RepID=UPI00187EF949|nr:phosphoribosylamine--glycine ligase [cf. Phormidesmis sp. LEGE 11477]MBE9062521.1 phosphoribosylamine--glycine ligase [cf. Phormidesmis sp. LEGE 11477]